MYNVSAAIACSVLSALALAASGVAGPKIACDDTVKDFGILNSNTQAMDHTFTVWNRGDATLQIQGVVSGCGCTTANTGSNTLGPGENTPIKVHFTLHGRKGPQRKDIRIVSDDPLTPQLVLQVACDIQLPIDTDVTGFYFGRTVAESQEVARTVLVKAASNVTFNITGVDTSTAPSVIVETRTVETGKVYAITATVRMDTLSSGMTTEKIAIRTDCPALPELLLPVSLYKAEEVTIIPNELPLLERVIALDEVTRDLYLRLQGTNRWEFFDVEPVGTIRVSVVNRQPHQLTIHLSNLAGIDDIGSQKLAVTVRCPATGADRRIEVKIRRYVPKSVPGPRAVHTTNSMGTGTFRQIPRRTPDRRTTP